MKRNLFERVTQSKISDIVRDIKSRILVFFF